MKTIAILIVVLFIVSGCSPAVRTTKFQHYPAKPAETNIKIYRHKAPQCEFEEIGIVSSRQRNKMISMAEVMASLLSETRRLGGDAIVGLNETNPIHNVSNEYGVDRDPVLSGTVIRFVNQGCAK